MGLEAVVELVKEVFGVDTLMKWINEKLVTEYGVKNIEVKRVKDAVVLVIRADEDNLDGIERELRSSVASLGFGEKVEVDVEVE